MTFNKVAVVSGSNKGIGLAIVRALCKDFNGDVFICSRNNDAGKEAVKKLESEGISPKCYQLDINDEASILKLKSYMEQNYGGIDVLVNNAGIWFNEADKTPFGTQARVTIDTNYYGTLRMSKLLIPIIKNGGRVVNLSGFLSLMCMQKLSPELQEFFRSDTITEEQLSAKMEEFIAAAEKGNLPNMGYPKSALGMSKLGVAVMTWIHARWVRELGKNDVLVNACCPGWVRTDMAGDKATKSPDEGAITPTYLALLPDGAKEPHGKFLSDKTIKPW